MDRFYTSEGIVIRRRNYKEADRLVVLLTPDRGLVNLLAKSVRTIKSRKRGYIESFSQIKFKAVKAKGFDILTEAEILASFENIRTNITRSMVAYFYAETIIKLSSENQELDGAYDLLVKYLNDLDSRNHSRGTRHNFVQELVVELGYFPKGKKLLDPDEFLESIAERPIHTLKIGRKVLKNRS